GWGWHALAQLILFGAFLSLLKIFNGNFVAATRMVYALGRRRVVHPTLGQVHAAFGTPAPAIVLVAIVTIGGALLGDAILVPVTEVGSLTVGIGWASACIAYVLRARGASTVMAWLGAAVSGAIVLMKIVPAVP